MKKVILYALATGLIVGAGCSKKEEVQAPVKPAPTPPVQEVKKSEPVPVVKAEPITKMVTQKTEETVAAVKVKAEEVMAELTQPLAEVKKKVAKLDPPQLTAYADTYKEVLLEKKDQLLDLTQNLKTLSLVDMMGQKGRTIKDQISQYTKQVTDLKDRYSIYLDQLKALGIDLSKYHL